MEEKLKEEFGYLDAASMLALLKAAKKVRLDTIENYRNLLKIYFITGGDLNDAEQFFAYVDKIAEAMKGDK